MPRICLPLLNARFARLNFSLFVVLACLLTSFLPGSRAAAQITCTTPQSSTPTCTSGSCTVTQTLTTNPTNSSGDENGCQYSSVKVSLGGKINSTSGSVQVTLTGVTTGSANDGFGLLETNFILVGPDGGLVLLGGAGDGGQLTSQSYTVTDGASVTLTSDSQAMPANNSTINPASLWGVDGFGSSTLPNGVTADYPSSDGHKTLSNGASGEFSGTPTDGTWTLYVENSGTNTTVSITGWTLALSYSVVAADDTQTTVSSGANPANLGTNTVLFTATVTDIPNGTTTVSDGTVTFVDDTTGTTLCSNVNVSSGSATCSPTANSIQEGISKIEADYTGGTGFNNSKGTMRELIEGTTTPSNPTSNGDLTWCNSGQPVDPGAGGIGMIFPSIIKVSGVGKSIAGVTVSLNNINTTTSGLTGAHLLVAPDGTHNLDILDKAFDGSTVSGVSLTIADSALNYPDGTGTPSNNGTYSPTDNYVNDTTFTDPNPSAHSLDPANLPDLPGTINYSYRHGSINNSLETAFSGISPNGDWALYLTALDSETETLTGGWCLNFTLNTGTSTTTTVSSSANGVNLAHVGDSVTLSATVKDSSNNVVTGGQVTFEENGVAPAGLSGNNTVFYNNTAGAFTVTTSSLTEGDHTIVAKYLGDANDDESQGQIIQRIDHKPVFTETNGVISACNPGEIAASLQTGTTGDGNTGPFVPNPSNIFAANLPGTIQSVTLGLNGVTTQDAASEATQAMVAGPNGKGLDFFSGTGGSSFGGPFTMTFSDSAPGLVPQSAFASPYTYQPTDYTNGDTFFASSSTFYPLPSSIGYADSIGSSTFAGQFPDGSFTGNGTWSLFFNITAKLLQETVANGWCLNFTQNPVTITPTLGHNGTGAGGDFVQGEQAATITLNVENNGAGSTGDPATTNPLTVTDTLNSELAYNSSVANGTDWTCTPSGQTVTCTNHDSVAQNSSYSPGLTIGVNVSNSAAGGNISNQVSISGAGITPPTNPTDTILIMVPPAITSGNATTFTVGQNGTFTVTTTGFPTPSLNETGALPTGVNFTDNGNGTATISGTPAAFTGGQYTITIGADNGAPPNASQSFTLTVDQAPSITSANATTFTVGTPGTFSVTTAASTYPTAALSDTGALPGGVSFTDNGNGTATLAGTPAAGTGGQYTITINAGNGVVPNASQTFTLTVDQAPAITSANNTTFQVGASGSFSVAATGFPAPSFAITSGTLPSGVTLTPGGLLSGTPGFNTNSTYPVTIEASNGIAPPFDQSFTLTVSPAYTLVVNVASPDDSGTAANCTPQNSPAQNTTDSSCGLRDALAESQTVGAANIYFDSTKFTSATTINASNGTLVIPADTAIFGLTSGGSISVQGSSSGPVFSLASGLAASISNLTITGASGSNGSGISNNGTLTVSDSTISGNNATNGGGINNSGGTLTVNNGTISGNQATNGAGLYVNSGTVTINDGTISGNSSGTSSGGIDNASGTVTLANTIVAGNTAPADPDVSGGLDPSSSSNLIGDPTGMSGITNGSNGNLVGTSGTPLLPALANLNNYGGPTQTMVPLPGSPAICVALLANVPSGATTDQRGYPLQPSGGYCSQGSVDIGAVQTNYTAVQFVQQPTDVAINATMSPAPTIEVLETDTLLSTTDAVGGISITVTPSGGTYAGSPFTANTSSTSPFLDTLSSLVSTSTASGISLATSPIPVTGSFSLSAVTSNTYNVTETAANIILPVPNSTLAGPKVPFTWTSASGATAYKLWIGTSPGTNNLYTSGPVTSNSVTPTLPANGQPVYVTLVTVYGPSQVQARYTYTAATPAALTSPAPNTVIAGPLVPFVWSSAPGAASYKLWIGSSAGKNDIYTSGTVTSTTVTPSLPTNGEALYVTLTTVYDSSQVVAHYTLTAATPAVLTAPAANSVLAGPAVPFTWSAAPGVTAYKLWIGSSAGKNDLYTSGPITTTTATADGLPANGETVYATLVTIYPFGVVEKAYSFTSATQAALITPVGPALSGASVPFTWSTAPGATAYKLWVGTAFSEQNVYSSGPITTTNATATRLPANGETVYVTLVTVYGSNQVYAHYTFTSGP